MVKDSKFVPIYLGLKEPTGKKYAPIRSSKKSASALTNYWARFGTVISDIAVGLTLKPAWVGGPAGLRRLQPGQFYLHPGPHGEASIVRWTAPARIGARVRVRGQFLPGDIGILQTGIFVNGVPQVTKPYWHSSDSGRFDILLPIAAGDTIDFAVYGGYMYGTTPLEATITNVPATAATPETEKVPGTISTPTRPMRNVLRLSQHSDKSYVHIPASASLNSLTDGSNTQLSLTMWVYPTEEMDNNGILYKGGLGRTQGVFQVSFAHGLGQPNKLNFRLNGAADEAGELTSDEHIPLNRWTFIACAYDGAQQRIYIDGKLSASAPYRMPLQRDESDAFIGVYQSTTYLYAGAHYLCFQGSIADVGIWKKGLDSAAISALYDAGLRGLPHTSRALGPKLLIAGYALDEGRGQTVADFTNNGNRGTIKPGATWTPSAFSTGQVIPPSLPPGSRYQLLLITGGSIQATSSDIKVYNDFAAAQITNPALTSLGVSWKAARIHAIRECAQERAYLDATDLQHPWATHRLEQ